MSESYQAKGNKDKKIEIKANVPSAKNSYSSSISRPQSSKFKIWDEEKETPDEELYNFRRTTSRIGKD